MHLGFYDWLVVAAYFVIITVVGLYYTKKASGSMVDYFITGRALPWWLAGTAMVSATFAADTPLAVSGMVAQNGIAGNWLWWNMVMSGILTVFFFARLWRRAGVLTDIEFTELRYSGDRAAILRGFRAIYLGIPINCIVMGWVLKAMVRVLELTTGISTLLAVTICVVITASYTIFAGSWGITITAFIQFIVKMGAAIMLAVYAISYVGGITAMKAKLVAQLGAERGSEILAFTPDIGSAWMPAITFFVYIAVQWWAQWYPGAEPGGGGFIAQRMFSSKDEKNSLLGTLWFNVAHYALRPWFWIVVALVSLIMFPDLKNKEDGYLMVMIKVLPEGMMGVMLAGFAAAFMASFSTLLNLGTSYLVNDYYRRFMKKDGSEKHYVMASRLTTVLVLVITVIISFFLESIAGAWKFLIALGAGTGLVYILRWFWWRINAWSEISAMSASFVVSLLLQYVFKLDINDPIQFAHIMLWTVCVSTATWLIVTYMTQPEPDETLFKFYRKVYPGGIGWKFIRERMPKEVFPKQELRANFFLWIAGCILVYGSIFGIGKLFFAEFGLGALYIAIGLIAGWSIYFYYQKRGWEAIAE